MSAEEIKFSYWTDAKPPFAIVKDNKLISGIIKDLGDEIGARTGFSITYVQLPVARVEPKLTSGDIHVSCITNPKWLENAASYGWSPMLFMGEDRFLILKDRTTISEFGDLKGLRIGTYNAYKYHQEIMNLLDLNDAIGIQIGGVEVGIELVLLERLHTLIDFGTILKYHIKHHPKGYLLDLAEKPADRFDLFCAYSPHLPVKYRLLDQAIILIKEQGVMEAILNRYE